MLVQITHLASFYGVESQTVLSLHEWGCSSLILLSFQAGVSINWKIPRKLL